MSLRGAPKAWWESILGRDDRKSYLKDWTTLRSKVATLFESALLDDNRSRSSVAGS